MLIGVVRGCCSPLYGDTFKEPSSLGLRLYRRLRRASLKLPCAKARRKVLVNVRHSFELLRHDTDRKRVQRRILAGEAAHRVLQTLSALEPHEYDAIF